MECYMHRSAHYVSLDKIGKLYIYGWLYLNEGSPQTACMVVEKVSSVQEQKPIQYLITKLH